MVQSSDRFNRSILYDWIEQKINEESGFEKYDTTFITHEELSGHPHGYNNVNPFVTAENLHQAFPNAKVLIIVRNQIGYLASIYSFRVAIKGHDHRSFIRFLREEGRMGLWEKLKYDKIIAHYIRLFSRKNVLVLPMELLGQDKKSFVNEIASFVELEPPELTESKKVNKSTNSTFALNVFRLANYVFRVLFAIIIKIKPETDEEFPYFRFRYRFYNLKRRFRSALEKTSISKDDFTINRKHYKDILNYYCPSNRTLQGFVKFDLKKLGYHL